MTKGMKCKPRNGPRRGLKESAHAEKLGGMASRSQFTPRNLDPIFAELKDSKLRSDWHWRVSPKHHVGSGLGVGGGHFESTHERQWKRGG